MAHYEFTQEDFNFQTIDGKQVFISRKANPDPDPKAWTSYPAKFEGDYYKCFDCLTVASNDAQKASTEENGQVFPLCAKCATQREIRAMRETGKAVLYLTCEPLENNAKAYYATDWLGNLKIPILPNAIKKSRHNMAGKDGRTDAWFRYAGREWHGVNIGDNQILRCKAKTKR